MPLNLTASLGFSVSKVIHFGLYTVTHLVALVFVSLENLVMTIHMNDFGVAIRSHMPLKPSDICLCAS